MEQTSIVKGNHTYAVMLKQLDKFIEKYVICHNCKYPELSMMVEGKDLKSKCNSCGSIGNHDSMHKAGKALINYIKQGGGQIVDITKKDKAGHQDDEMLNDGTGKKSKKNRKKVQEEESPEVIVEKKDKKKDKKDKKKKKEKNEGSESEKEQSMSEDDESLTW